MKKGIALVLILALGAGLKLWTANSEPQAPTYRLATVEKGAVRLTVSATGTLQAVTSIEVGSQVSGIINQVFVKHNSEVTRGQILAQLDPSTYQTAITQAQASVVNAESTLANSQADAGNAAANARAAEAAILTAQAGVETAQVGVVNAQAAISSAQARLSKAEATRDNARKSASRNEDLLARELIAVADVDSTSATLAGAEADVLAAQADLQTAYGNLSSAEVQVRAAQTEVEAARIKREAASQQQASAQAKVRGYQAQVTQAQANLKTAQINLDRTAITSPIDGVVLDVSITAGQTVAAQLQAPNLFTLAQDLSQMQVETSVDEADISKVKEGSRATFTVDAFPAQKFQGTVAEVRQSPTTTNGVVTYMVIVRTDNPKGSLRPGMTATVDIIAQEKSEVLRISSEALNFKPAQGDSSSQKGGSRVYTLEGERLVPHEVRTGLDDGVHIEVAQSDLKVGQKLVLGVEEKSSTSSSGNSTKSSSRSGGGRPPGPPGMF